MPGAVAVHPRDGQAVRRLDEDRRAVRPPRPARRRRDARFENYARGLFQDAFSMLAEDDGLYVLHRRNLTRVVDTDGDGAADRFDRVAALPHGVADTYDGLRPGPRPDRRLRLQLRPVRQQRRCPARAASCDWSPGKPPRGGRLRDAQPARLVRRAGRRGLLHRQPGRLGRREQALPRRRRPVLRLGPTRPRSSTPTKPAGKAGGLGALRLGPVDQRRRLRPHRRQVRAVRRPVLPGRADVRRGHRPGQRREGERRSTRGRASRSGARACSARCAWRSTRRGQLYVGGITEPGWMAQPDRGALFRIDFTGEVPFEMQSIHVRPRGFRIVFTAPVDRRPPPIRRRTGWSTTATSTPGPTARPSWTAPR